MNQIFDELIELCSGSNMKELGWELRGGRRVTGMIRLKMIILDHQYNDLANRLGLNWGDKTQPATALIEILEALKARNDDLQGRIISAKFDVRERE